MEFSGTNYYYHYLLIFLILIINAFLKLLVLGFDEKYAYIKILYFITLFFNFITNRFILNNILKNIYFIIF